MEWENYTTPSFFDYKVLVEVRSLAVYHEHHQHINNEIHVLTKDKSFIPCKLLLN